MTMQEMLNDREKAGKANALALVRLMIQDSLTAEVARLDSDETFYAQMLEKYHLNEGKQG